MDIDANDTDIELTMTPTSASKSSKSLTLLEKAQHLKSGFKDSATDEEILRIIIFNYIIYVSNSLNRKTNERMVIIRLWPFHLPSNSQC